MDFFLDKVTSQAMNYAIRSGLGIAAGYAIKQSNKLLTNAPKSGVRDELFSLQQRIEHKIRIISPAIDMIDLIAARGNTSLESAIALTKELRQDIHAIGQRLAQAATTSANTNRISKISIHAKTEQEVEMRFIVVDMKKLLERLEDALPLISLAITTSGVTLSTSLPHTVSPSRLLQASTLLTAGDTQYTITPRQAVQIGPTFTLTVYMLFAGHDRPQNEEELRETTWKEVIHKARVKLRRVPLDVVAGTGSGSDALPSADIRSPTSDPVNADIPAEARSEEFAYQLMIVEDFEDDRMHDFEDDQPQPGSFDDVMLAGIREMIPIHEVSKIFYADTSKVLNIGTDAETNHPVLLLKRDLNAVLPRGMAERAPADPGNDTSARSKEEQDYVDADHQDRRYDPWRLPPSLDTEWIAFEVYTESANDSSSESEPDNSTDGLKPSPSLEDSISKLNISSPPLNTQLSPSKPSTTSLATTAPPPWVNAIRTTLSLLELLLRLTSLQQFQQQSHLSITDELLNFFLEESASTGAGGDEQQRKTTRQNARRRVGWDPYDESPVKRRGEEYQYQRGGKYYDDRYGYGSPGTESRRQVSPGVYGNGSVGAGWGNSPHTQTRSITKLTDNRSRSQMQIHMQSPQSPSPSPSISQLGVGSQSRPDWLKRPGLTSERKGSPLRPSTGMTDEGLGTSPATIQSQDGETSGVGEARDGGKLDQDEELRRLETEYLQKKAEIEGWRSQNQGYRDG